MTDRSTNSDSSKPEPQTRDFHDDPNVETLTSIMKLTNKVTAPFSAFLERQLKVSLNEFRIMMLIGRFPGIASHEMVYLSGISPMSVSRGVTTLQQHGRIETVRDPENGRRKVHYLSAEGTRLFDIMQPVVTRVANFLVASLQMPELEEFNSHIAKLTAGLEQTDENGNSLFLEAVQPKAAEMGLDRP